MWILNKRVIINSLCIIIDDTYICASACFLGQLIEYKGSDDMTMLKTWFKIHNSWLIKGLGTYDKRNLRNRSHAKLFNGWNHIRKNIKNTRINANICYTILGIWR